MIVLRWLRSQGGPMAGGHHIILDWMRRGMRRLWGERWNDNEKIAIAIKNIKAASRKVPPKCLNAWIRLLTGGLPLEHQGVHFCKLSARCR
eukprot:2261032-Amphidinium_carterae.1